MSEDIDGPWELPRGWAWAPFADVARVASNLVSPFDYPDLPHIAPNHIESETGRLLPFSTVAEDGVKSPKHLFASGHILYSKIRPYLAKVVMAKFDGLCSADMYPIATELDPGYLTLWLRSPAFTGLAANHQGRSVLPKINKEALAKLPIPVPPLEEQRRIVNALEGQLSRLDAAAGIASQVRSKLLAYKASREREIVPSPQAGIAEQPLPDGWKMVRLSDISHSSGYGTSAKCGYDGAGGAVLRIPNIQSGAINADDLKYALDENLDLGAYKVSTGDLLIVRTNGSRDLIGRVAVSREDTEYAFASYLIRFKVKMEDAFPDWVAKVISTRPWRQLIESAAASTAGQYNLNLKKLGSLPIPLPPLEEQRPLTAELDEIDASVRRLTSAVDDASLKGEALRRSLLAEAFAGRLVPQDPTDEPADALLHRIRAEREAAGATKSRHRSPRRASAQCKRTPDTAPVPDAPPPLIDAPALATATQPTLDLEIPS
ncbi:restriction endonuclease subunit S [Streptomyces sp. NPDC012403]|uniref:restriction endonuclease subunit S n=1 Tax=Streptomyces sp. NPDC012403 TaxID=3364831 RepID=UPI0036E7F2BB